MRKITPILGLVLLCVGFAPAVSAQTAQTLPTANSAAALSGVQPRSIPVQEPVPNRLISATTPQPGSPAILDPDRQVVFQELDTRTQLVVSPANVRTEGGLPSSGAGLTGNNQVQVIHQLE